MMKIVVILSQKKHRWLKKIFEWRKTYWSIHQCIWFRISSLRRPAVFFKVNTTKIIFYFVLSVIINNMKVMIGFKMSTNKSNLFIAVCGRHFEHWVYSLLPSKLIIILCFYTYTYWYSGKSPLCKLPLYKWW